MTILRLETFDFFIVVPDLGLATLAIVVIPSVGGHRHHGMKGNGRAALLLPDDGRVACSNNSTSGAFECKSIHFFLPRAELQVELL